MKTFLIHLLGGITLRESEQSNEHCLKVGSAAALRHLKAFADQMNGIPADEWSKLMYNQICGSLARLETPNNKE